MKRILPLILALGLAALLLALLPGASGASISSAPLHLRSSAPPHLRSSAPSLIRPSDDITTYTYLPLVMRAYRPPPPPPVYPNDPYTDSQWGLSRINAPAAWAISRGDGVLIAVLDTGADFSHPDLAGKLRGDIDWDLVNNDSDASDDHGHGTHVSGIAAVATNNGIGVAGLGWNAAILPLKVMDSRGEGSSYDLASAIYYAAEWGARVINMSLGGPYPCPSYLQDAIDHAYNRGVLLVAAAGNDGQNQTVFPANCAHVLGVAATTSYDTRASFSNYGDHVSVAAPGVDILSTCWPGMGYGSYCYMDGTSMATPFVAGLAALVYAAYPTYTPDQVASAILDNAQDLGTSGWDQYFGCGRIDAFRAVWEGARGNYPVCLGARVWSMAASPGVGTGKEAAFVPGEVIVTLRSGASVSRLLRRHGLATGYTDLYSPPGVQWIRVWVPVGAERAFRDLLRADPDVLSADLNYLIHAR